MRRTTTRPSVKRTDGPRKLLTRIVVTGSECTGKTTLAQGLAERYGTVWVPEFARRFVARKGAPLTAADVDEIARGQIALEDRRSADAERLLIQDTDLLSTVVYSRHYYRRCPAWIEEALDRRPADLYLLAGIDVPWMADGHQRDRRHRREEIQALFFATLTSRGLPYVEVAGSHPARMERAVAAIDDLLPRSRRASRD